MCWLGRSIRTYSHLICSGAGGNARFDCYLFEWSLSFNSHGRFVSPFPDHPSARKGSMMHSLPCQSALHAQATLDLRLFGWTGSAFMLRLVLLRIGTGRRWAGIANLFARCEIQIVIKCSSIELLGERPKLAAVFVSSDCGA